MARPLRIQYPGAWYHVTCRGNERAFIYKDNEDRKRFLAALEESIDAYQVEVHCYILMSNHFHLLVKTPEANLSRFMQRFNTAYTTYYNLRHKRNGHLYQGRYKAILVEADEYLLELSRYIHLNPVRLDKRKDSSLKEKIKILQGYTWSSMPGFVNPKKRNGFAHYEEVLAYMGGDTKKGRKQYQEFVMKGLAEKDDSPLGETKASAILGTDDFIDWVKERFLDGRDWSRKNYPHIPELEQTIQVKEIAKAVAREYGVEHQEIMRPRSKWREARQVLIEMSYRVKVTKKSLHEVGSDLGGISGDAVAHAHGRIQRKLLKDQQLSKRLERIYRHIRQ